MSCTASAESGRGILVSVTPLRPVVSAVSILAPRVMRRPLNRPSPLVGHFEKHLAKLRVIALFGKPRALVCVLLVIFDYCRHQSPSHQRVRNLPVANPAYGPFVAIDVPTVQGSASRLCDARSSACDGPVAASLPGDCRAVRAALSQGGSKPLQDAPMTDLSLKKIRLNEMRITRTPAEAGVLVSCMRFALTGPAGPAMSAEPGLAGPVGSSPTRWCRCP